MQQQPSILEYGRGAYLKVALLVCAAAIGVYVWHDTPAVYLKPYGGTWLGYTLGTIGAVLILWLMLLGLRKRRYSSRLGSVQGWTSAHVYLGASLLVIVTLHTGFEFGWNVHTFAYALMVLVIISGAVGVYTYLHYPALMTKNLGDDSLEATLLKVNDLDRKCRRMALDMPDEVNKIVMKATRAGVRQGRVGASMRKQLKGDSARSPTSDACAALMRFGSKYTGEQGALLAQLVGAMTRKSTLIERVRRDLRYRALIQVWLYAHVPLSFALLAALIAHVVAVFYFW